MGIFERIYRGGRGETRYFSRSVELPVPDITVSGQSCLEACGALKVEGGLVLLSTVFLLRETCSSYDIYIPGIQLTQSGAEYHGHYDRLLKYYSAATATGATTTGTCVSPTTTTTTTATVTTTTATTATAIATSATITAAAADTTPTTNAKDYYSTLLPHYSCRLDVLDVR